jgi:large subunit ribosomal protein L29
MNTIELRELSTSELVARKRELKDELFHLRLQKASGQLEKPSQFKNLRKEVARIETVITERTLAKAQAEQGSPSK